MKPTLPNIRKLAGRGRTEDSAGSGDINDKQIETSEAAEPKPPPPLPMFFMLSHLEEDGPVRLDGVKLAVLEVMGLELDEPKLGAFAGSLNALDFPVQLLVRQHPPVLQQLRTSLEATQPEDLPQQTREAAESLGRLLGSVVIFTVIPAKAGIQRPLAANAYLPATGFRVPASAGMTETDAWRPIFLN